MHNLTVALVLSEIASLLEIKGVNRYKIRAYKEASKKVRRLNQDIKTLIEKDQLTSLPGIGAGLAEKIKEIALTGSCKYYLELITEYPASLIPLLKISGVGSSKVRKFYNKLEIENLQQLKEAAKVGKLSTISGIGNKTEAKILDGVNKLLDYQGKVNLAEARELANKFKIYLEKLGMVNKVKIVGSVRRKMEVINTINLVVDSTNNSKLVELFKDLSIISEVLTDTKEKLIVKTKLGVKVTLNFTTAEKFEQRVFWLTGSKEYNQQLQKMMENKTISENEFNKNSEEKIFKKIGLPYIIPELRDSTDTLFQTQKNKLPVSIKLQDIKGDLHMHSDWSDGHFTIEEMAKACQKRGYQYLAICDHTQTLTIAGGLTPDELNRQIKQINQLNQKLDITILSGAEVDILKSGLDYPNEILKKLDLVTASIHSGFGDSQDKIMNRINLALENPYVNVLGHPTGRLILEREPYNINVEGLIKKAVETNTILEINSSPRRLDLNAKHVRLACKLGAKFVINTDAHHTKQLENMKYGVGVARKGWLEKDNVINTLTLNELKKIL